MAAAALCVAMLGGACGTAAAAGTARFAPGHAMGLGRMPQIAIAAEVTGGATTLVMIDGSVLPDGPARVALWLTLDGAPIGNRAVLDWLQSRDPVGHGFRILAAPALPPGPHRLALMAVAEEGGAALAEGAGMSVVAAPGLRVVQNAATVQVETDPLPLIYGQAPGFVQVARLLTSGLRGPVVAFAAGNAASSADPPQFGDAFWTLRVDGALPAATDALYADNDICACAELAAPLSAQGVFDSADQIELGAGAEPWNPKLGADRVAYSVAPGATLVALSGAHAAGGLRLDIPAGAKAHGWFTFRCIASSTAWPRCPAAGDAVTLGQTEADLPAAGPVLISAALRLQADAKDAGGRFEMWLMVDGRRVGTTAIQDLRAPSAVSTRTPTASWAGNLGAGAHTLGVQVLATGVFQHLVVARGLLLAWIAL